MESNPKSLIQNAAKAQAVAKSNKQKLVDYINGVMAEQIRRALPSVITPERFTRMVLSALSTTPQLAECTQDSFLGAMMTAAQLGLEPNTPLEQCFLIPRKIKGELKCVFEMGYQGLLDLAYRSNLISVVQAHEVCDGDEFVYAYGLEPKLYHKIALTGRGAAYAYYAMFKTKDGGYGFEVTSREDVERYARKYSDSYESSYSPWKTSFDQMAKKTLLKQALKYAPKKSDFVRGIEADNTIKSTLAPDMSEVPNEDDYIDADAVVVEEKPNE